MFLPGRLVVMFGLLVLVACGGSNDEPVAGGQAASPEPEPVAGHCSDYQPGYKNVYFGDLHTHTSYSLDAYFFNALTDPRAAHRFAKGAAPLPQPALGSDDVFNVGREITIDRPLDFNAVTDHAEFLGGFFLFCDNSEQTQALCDQLIGQGIRDDVVQIAAGETPFQTQVLQSVASSLPSTIAAWSLTKQMNDEEYEPCSYTTLHGYEYTSQESSQMFHRNVIFNGPTESAPLNVISSVNPTTPLLPENGNDDWDLFDQLNLQCPEGSGCRVLTIPHNANLSDGRMYLAAGEAAGNTVLGDLEGVPLGRKLPFTNVYFPMTADDAALRQRIDRSFEMTQHKGQSECAAGLEGDYLANDEGYDPACGFEINKSVCTGAPGQPASCEAFCTGDPLTDPNFCSHGTPPSNQVEVCEETGPDGASHGADSADGTGNCTHPLDYYRNAMAEGLKIRQTLGVNPYKINITAALDTHGGDSGDAGEYPFLGHGGVLDDDPAEQLGFWNCGGGGDPADPANCTDRKFQDFARTLNPGGLAGVWAPQNNRDEIWQAIHRGESFGTSGPRLRIRSIASWDPLPQNICDRLATGEDLIATGQVAGARMGGDLPPAVEGAKPHFAVWAQQDPEGYPLQSVDIIKGYVDANGEGKVRVHNGVVTTSQTVSRPSMQDCSVEVGQHPSSFCAVWVDEDFQSDRDAYWYARVREVPSCRWSAWVCNVENDVDCSLLDASNGMFPQDSGLRGYEGCCVISGEPGSFSGQKHFHTIEERAWASPVWYETTQ